MNIAARMQALLVIMACAAAGPVTVVSAADGPGDPAGSYEDTKTVLAEIYHDEVRAYSSYRIYGDRAAEEGYPKIAALFSAITVSEMIHARNVKALLAELGEEVTDEEFTVEVGTTKENLKHGMDVELAEIGETYPAYLERLEVEGWEPAIEAVRYSWNSEKQHSEHLRRIRRFVGFFFGAVAKEIESGPEFYHVCTTCGSTVDKRPEATCTICGSEAALSVKVPGDDAPAGAAP